eukprot:4405239-Amphidinium_carterae.1
MPFNKDLSKRTTQKCKIKGVSQGARRVFMPTLVIFCFVPSAYLTGGPVSERFWASHRKSEKGSGKDHWG